MLAVEALLRKVALLIQFRIRLILELMKKTSNQKEQKRRPRDRKLEQKRLYRKALIAHRIRKGVKVRKKITNICFILDRGLEFTVNFSMANWIAKFPLIRQLFYFTKREENYLSRIFSTPNGSRKFKKLLFKTFIYLI